MPKLSIITVNLNNAKGLQKTIESVISQTFTDYEYIIIDGGSTDESKEIIEKYSNEIVYWVSEQDKGIYNGMNKGIKVAKGEYCLFLNSGDRLINNKILDKVFNLEFKEDIIYGNIKTELGESSFLEKLTLYHFFFSSLAHPATFIKRELFNDIGLYNEKNKIVSDWEFFIIAIFIEKKTYKYINFVVSFFELGGISSDEKYRNIDKKERIAVLKKNFPLIYDDYIDLYNYKKELQYYKDSRLINTIKKIQTSRFYKFLRNKK